MAQSFDSWSSGGYDWGNSGFGDNTQYRQDDQGSEHYGGYNIENTQSYNYFEPEQHYVDNNKQNQGFMNPQSNFYNNQYYTPAEDPNSLYGQMAMSSSSSLSTGRKSVLSNSAFSPNNFDEDEPPLLEELGINFSHIQQKTLAVLHPTKAADPAACQDNDLAGPLVFALAFGATLLLAGKIHFNYIYGIGVMGSLGMYMLLNLMSVDGCGFLGVVSVLGYCLLPMVGLSSVAVFISLKGTFGLIMSILCVGWASLASSKLFVSALTMNGQQMLIAYPCALVYGVFALLTLKCSMSKAGNFSLDFFLSTLLQSREFQSLPHKDWQLISVLVPGTTPAECESRFNELNQELKLASDLKLENQVNESRNATENVISIPSSRNATSASSASSAGTISAHPAADESAISKPSSRESHSKPSDKKSNSKFRTVGGSSSAGASVMGSANMVIHVCDEAKSIKQDFHCPRNLLVKEMKYFAEYLSVETNRCEDVDISVHCDVQIFDWLMRYVKREGPKTTPKLEPNNAVSILISSDFLKMDSLVQECIDYCADNLEDIVATPCNMNCIQDRLLTTLCNKFNHNQLEALKDKKDKIRSKLFAKKIEQLFDSRTEYSDAQYSASTMYKCQYCLKLLIHPIQSSIPCLASRMFVNNTGAIMYKHARDISWDVNEYLISLIRELKSWRNVYWQVWGVVNCLYCSKCHTHFQVRLLANCLFHTSRMHTTPQSITTTGDIVDGTFACCGQKCPLFNPLSTPALPSVAGCCVRDHVIDSTARDTHPKMIQDLLRMRNEVCVPAATVSKSKQQEVIVNVFANEKLLLPKEDLSLFDKYSNTAHTPPTQGGPNGGAQDFCMHDMMMHPSTDSESDNDDGSLSGVSDDDDTNTSSTNQQQQSGSKGRASRFATNNASGGGAGAGDDGSGQKRSTSKKRRDLSKGRGGGSGSAGGGGGVVPSAGGTRKWDQNRSHRWNQDVQRNEDLRRFTEITQQLAKLRVHTNSDKKDLNPPPGGYFARLDWLFRQAVANSAKQSATSGMSGGSGSGSQGYSKVKGKMGQPGSGGKSY